MLHKIKKKILTQKLIPNPSRLLLGILSFLGTYGCCYMMSLAGDTRFSFGIMTIPFMIVTYFLLDWTREQLKKLPEGVSKRRRMVFVSIVSLVFAITMLMGYQLQKNGMTESGFKGKGMILLRSFCLAIPSFPFVNMIFAWADRYRGSAAPVTGEVLKIKENEAKASESGKVKCWNSKRVWLCCAVVIFLCWIPVWLAYYPVIMSYDFHRQAQEAMKGFIWFGAHHPLAHTWLIWLFLHLGEAIGSYETGLALFALFQMLISAAVMAYSCTMVYRIVKKKWSVILLLLFYGVFPFTSVTVMCTTKDVLFSSFFLLFVLLLVERSFFASGKKKVRTDIFLFLDGVLMILFRNNALYAVAVFAVILLLVWGVQALRARGKRNRPKQSNRNLLQLAVLCLLLAVAGKGALEGVQLALGTQIRGNAVEMYSIPIQQFARVGYYHGQELDEETHKLLDTYVSEKYWKKYNAPISDSVKMYVGSDNFLTHWKGNMGQVIKDWAKLGMQFPNEYIDAFLQLTRGYWFLDDVSYAEVLGSGLEGRMGAIYTYNSSESDSFVGVEHVSRFPWLEQKLENIVSANCFYQWPVISNLFKTATYCWLLVLVMLAFWYGKQKKQALLCLFPLLYFGTVLMGPVVQLRYVFPIMIAVPVLMALILLPSDAILLPEKV